MKIYISFKRKIDTKQDFLKGKKMIAAQRFFYFTRPSIKAEIYIKFRTAK